MHNPSGHDIVRITQIIHLNLCPIIVIWISAARFSLCTPDCCFDDADLGTRDPLSLTIASLHPCASKADPCVSQLFACRELCPFHRNTSPPQAIEDEDISYLENIADISHNDSRRIPSWPFLPILINFSENSELHQTVFQKCGAHLLTSWGPRKPHHGVIWRLPYANFASTFATETDWRFSKDRLSDLQRRLSRSYQDWSESDDLGVNMRG